MVATYADITARVEADLALKRANETLEQRVQEPHRRADPRQRGAGAGADAGRGGQSRQDALPGGGRPRHPAAAQRRPALLLLADRAGRQGRHRRGGRQHRILAGIGRDHSRRRARHFAARRRRDEAVRDACSGSTGCCARSAPISCRWPPRRSSTSTIVPSSLTVEHRPQPAAPAGPEPGLQRHQIHAQRPRAGRRAAARRTGRDCR